MKILLVHPDDSIEVGAWTKTRWDLAIDLGWSGRYAYSLQSQRLGFPVSSIYDLLDHEQHREQVREMLSLGLGQLVDSENVDWWDLLGIVAYPQLEEILLLSALAERIPQQAEIFITRPHASMAALALLFSRDRTKGPEIKSFVTGGRRGFRRFRRYWKAATTLRPSQITEIIFDKWDPDYKLRRNFRRPPGVSSTPAVLLPSAYSNVTRAQIAYARMLPHRRFLLVVTRPNGRVPGLPGNVELRWLSSYAPRWMQATKEDEGRLLMRWRQVLDQLFEMNGVLRSAKKLHVFDNFASSLRNGLRLRDAWREVLVREPITAVLSADENNPTTRLPTILARLKKLRTVFCEHGALNMTFGMRPLASDTYLLRGEMARDYSIGWCGVPADKIVVGGPAEPREPVSRTPLSQKDRIVFYSEPYELYSRRTQSFYAEFLPELCSLGKRMNCRVIVKLHPFESLRVRKAMVDRALSAAQREIVEVREGPMTADLFERALCSLTVESTVAVESTAQGVPCFLCRWFDASWYDYGKQYTKFSAGYPLDSPERIREIPDLLEQMNITEEIQRGLQSSITPQRLESVLSGTECTGG